MKLEYIAHSAFALDIDGQVVLIDPFITQNPLANYEWKNYKVKDILVTHGHSDHLGDAITIAKEHRSATISAVFELANYCAKFGVKTNGVGIGAKISYDWGSAWFVPAKHSSSTPDGNYAGCAAGVILNINGTKIYHAGDTSLTSEMQLIKDIYKPNIALLPIGGQYTMGIDEAAIASKILGVEKVIPMHYNTFPAINADVSAFKYKVETYGIEAIIMSPGEKIEL